MLFFSTRAGDIFTLRVLLGHAASLNALKLDADTRLLDLALLFVLRVLKVLSVAKLHQVSRLVDLALKTPEGGLNGFAISHGDLDLDGKFRTTGSCHCEEGGKPWLERGRYVQTVGGRSLTPMGFWAQPSTTEIVQNRRPTLQRRVRRNVHFVPKGWTPAKPLTEAKRATKSVNSRPLRRSIMVKTSNVR
jgi:hypothetical protein